ncbi:MAG: hypothetical protein GJ676_07400 [Rhodobacteraceae bacterium]|nr:hypothetical protein [Paracoccaceae bacterium]
MQIIVHTGAHATSEDRLMKCLLSNVDGFQKQGVAVPGPGKYRDLIKQSCKALEQGAPSPDAREILLDAILDEEEADRLVLSVPNLFSSRNYVLDDGMLYPQAGKRVGQLKQLFQHDQLEIFMAIRNPAILLPSVLGKAPEKVIAAALNTTDLMQLRWADMIEDIRMSAPNVPVTVWCYEDAPLIWAQIIREMAGLDHGEKITGGFDLLSTIMTREGMKRFRAYLHEHKSLSEVQKRRVIAAFLDKFAIEDELEEELDLPDWTEELVDAMSDAYDEDVYQLQRIPGVQFIAP